MREPRVLDIGGGALPAIAQTPGGPLAIGNK